MIISGSEAVRFWSKVSVGSPDQCWPWNCEVNNHGYGRFTTWQGNSRKRLLAHRLAFQLHAHKSIGKQGLMHTCDNPPCCNPRHLRLGTQMENLADMREKERHSNPPHLAGSRHPLSKLNESDVEEILRLLTAGNSQSSLGRRYGVSPSAIRSIALGRTWRHVRPIKPGDAA